MSELVEKEAVFNMLYNAHMGGNEFYDDLFELTEELPTVEERRKGKWETKMIDMGFFDADAVVCSECKDITDIAWRRDPAVKYFKFCPLCGAEMKGEANESSAKIP